MKFLYLLLGIVFFIGIMVLWFQLMVGTLVTVPFFTWHMRIVEFEVIMIVGSMLSWVFLTLGIKWFISWENSSNDDDFDL